MAKEAIVLGGTGATGSKLVRLLLKDERYSKIKLFSRSGCDIHHNKIEEHLIDLFELENYTDVFTGNDVFCCIGTTKAKTPKKKKYKKIDYGIPVAAAKLAKANGITNFIVISAMGADENSLIFYNRIKGEMQHAVLDEGIRHTYLLQPSLIVAERKESRIMEKIGTAIMKFINPLLFGNAKKYRSITDTTIAKAMLWLANNKYLDTIITSDVIQKLGKA